MTKQTAKKSTTPAVETITKEVSIIKLKKIEVALLKLETKLKKNKNIYGKDGYKEIETEMNKTKALLQKVSLELGKK